MKKDLDFLPWDEFVIAVLLKESPMANRLDIEFDSLGLSSMNKDVPDERILDESH